MNSFDFDVFPSCFSSCPKHDKNRINLLVINLKATADKEVEQVLICIECAREMNLRYNDTLELDTDIFSAKIEKIFQNWPILNNPSFLKKCYQDELKANDLKDYPTQVKEVFQEIKARITQQIDKIMNENLLIAERLNNPYKTFQESYNIISKKEQLQSLISQSEQSLEVRQLQAKELITSVNNNQPELKDTLEKLLLQRDSQEQVIFEVPKQIMDAISFLLNKIDLFSDDKIKKRQSKERENVEQIMRIIANPFNFATKEYKSQLEQELNKNLPLISLIEFPEASGINPVSQQDSLTQQNYQEIAQITSVLYKKNRIIKDQIYESNQEFQTNNLKIYDLEPRSLNEKVIMDNFISVYKYVQEKIKTYENIFGYKQMEELLRIESNAQEQTEFWFCTRRIQTKDEGAKIIANIFSNCENLTVLEVLLRGNEITNSGVVKIGEGIEKLKDNLTKITLDLSENIGISEVGAIIIAEKISLCKNLKELDLRLEQNPSIGLKGILKIGDAISKCNNLTSLKVNLRQQYFIDKTFKAQFDDLIIKIPNLSTREIKI